MSGLIGREWGRARSLGGLIGRERIAAALAGLVAAGLATGLARTDLVRGFDERALGQLLRVRERPANLAVLVVAIDETTLDRLGWPVPRAEQAAVLAALGEAGALSVAYDIYLTGPAPDGAEADALFAGVARMGPPVIVPVEPSGRAGDPSVGERLGRQRLGPGPAADGRLRRHAGGVLPHGPIAGAGLLGHVLFLPSPSGTYRRVPLYESVGEAAIPALSLAAVMATDAPSDDEPSWDPGQRRMRFGSRQVRTDGQVAVVPSLRSDPAAATLSFQDLASALDPETGRLPPALAERIAGRYVLVGQTAHSIGDHGPAADGRVVPLVYVHAALLSDLLEGQILVDASRSGVLVLFAVMGLFFVAMGALLRPAVAVGAAALGLAGLWFYVTALMEGSGQLVPPVGPSLAALVAFGAATITRMVVHERERRVMRNAFGAYVAPEVLERVLADPDAFLTPQGTRKRLSILFSDVQGYTRLSNALPPEEVVALLREYLDAMTRIIFRHEGRVDKIMGDGILAYFGDLVPVEDHARRAVQCGLEMQVELERLVKRWASEGKDGLLVRVGVATGEVFVGNIGGAGHLEYTVLGPTVNLAARLESNAPSTGVLVSRETFEETRDAFDYRIVPGLVLKGFDEAYTAFLCVGVQGEAAPPGDDDERRRALRLQADAPVQVSLRDETFEGVVREVSAGGLLLEMAARAEEGEVLTIVFDAAIVRGLSSVHLAGRIRHVRAVEDGRVQAGVALMNVESGDPHALREFVALFFGTRPVEDRGEISGDAGMRFSFEVGETYARLTRGEE